MTLSSKLVPSEGVLFGVYPGSVCDPATSALARLHNHETAVNRTATTGGILNVANAYHDFDDFTSSFPSADEQVMSAEGRLLLIHWKPRIFGGTGFKWADIAAGVHDATYVDPTARAMRDWGTTFFLAFDNEMNVNSTSQGGTSGTDAEYASAARHVHDRFVVQGATNVVWVFKPSGYVATLSRMNTLYPGDWIDWIGYDPYGSGGETAQYVVATKYPMYGWATGTDPNYRKTSIPTGVTVTPQGTTGATTYSYKVTSRTAAGETVTSAAVQITNGNATLSGTNFNRVAWTVSSGATDTRVYGRTAGSWLLIATVTAPTATYDDTGAVTPSGAPPTVGGIGDLTKPLMWPEWGDDESATGTSKANFITSISGLLPNYPLIKLISWYNSGVNCFDTSTASRDAYKALAVLPMFNPDRSPTPPPPGAAGTFRAGASASFNNTTSKQLVIPSTVVAGDIMDLFHVATRTGLKNGCEGTNAANITTGNSNTVGSNPLDAIGASNVPTYSTAQFHSGASSWHPAVAAASVSQVRWDASFGSPSTYYGRMYFRIPSIPPNAATRIYQQSGAGGTPTQWGIGFDAAGKLIVRDIAGASTKWTSTATPATNTQHRVEWKAVWDGTNTTITVRPYFGASVDSTTATETPASFTLPQAAAGAYYQFGIFSSAAQTWDCFIDDVMLDVNAFPGPKQTYPVLTDPSGWSLLDTRQVNTGGGDLSGKLLSKVADASDPGSTLTLNTDVHAHGSILLVVYSGVDSVLDIEASNSKTSDGTTVTSPNVTTTVASDLIISAFFARDNPGALTTSWTVPSGETQRAASFGSGTADGRVAGLVTDDATTHAVGTYGSKVATSGNAITSHLGIAFTVALKTVAVSSTGQHTGFIYQPA